MKEDYSRLRKYILLELVAIKDLLGKCTAVGVPAAPMKCRGSERMRMRIQYAP